MLCTSRGDPLRLPHSPCSARISPARPYAAGIDRWRKASLEKGRKTTTRTAYLATESNHSFPLWEERQWPFHCRTTDAVLRGRVGWGMGGRPGPGDSASDAPSLKIEISHADVVRNYGVSGGPPGSLLALQDPFLPPGRFVSEHAVRTRHRRSITRIPLASSLLVWRMDRGEGRLSRRILSSGPNSVQDRRPSNAGQTRTGFTAIRTQCSNANERHRSRPQNICTWIFSL